MERQKVMEDSFVRAHREFVSGLERTVEEVRKDIDEATEMRSICTGEWCKATESVLDELAKVIFSISEPRFLTDGDSKQIKNLRHRVHDLYAKFKSVTV